MSKAAVPKIDVQLTVDEIRAIVTLTEDQLFRVKFIDPHMPGHRANPDRVQAAESALHRLKAAATIDPPHKKTRPSEIQLRIKRVS
jgi:hypothetical protein